MVTAGPDLPQSTLTVRVEHSHTNPPQVESSSGLAEVGAQQGDDEGVAGRRTDPGDLLIEPRHLMTIQSHLPLDSRLGPDPHRPAWHRTVPHHQRRRREHIGERVQVRRRGVSREIGEGQLPRTSCPPQPIQQIGREIKALSCLSGSLRCVAALSVRGHAPERGGP